MARNWPPSNPYPSWPPAELNSNWFSFSDIQTGITVLQQLGFTRSNPTAQENQAYFRNVECDEGHNCQGIMIVSPSGIRYPFAYCLGATHKSALVLWVVGISTIDGSNCYDLGWNSGSIT